jgi:hypothetical protein
MTITLVVVSVSFFVKVMSLKKVNGSMLLFISEIISYIIIPL